MPPKTHLPDLIGQKYGRLTIIEAYRNEKKNIRATCICDCGVTKTNISVNGMKRGHTTSCGCYEHEVLMKRNITHGLYHNKEMHKTYVTWIGMRDRCHNTNHVFYHRYGGRGIKVCERWDDFLNFLEDMGKKPDKMSLDRVDGDGDYCKDNCKWSTQSEQMRNMCDNRHLTFNGETHLVVEWAEITGIRVNILAQRLGCGWSIERTLTQPPKNRSSPDHPTYKIEYRGKMMTIQEVSKECGISQGALFWRLFKTKPAWTVEKATTVPVIKKYDLWYNGKPTTFKELSLETGIIEATLRYRITLCNMSVEDAVSKPIDIRRRRKQTPAPQTTLEVE